MSDEELIARLREGATWDDDIAAADRIEALVKEAVLSKAAYEGVSSLLLSVQQDCIKERQRAERLEAALRELVADAEVIMNVPAECYAVLRAALKGADHE